MTSHFYPVAHSVPHSVDIHQTHISGAVDPCQGCSPMRKPVLILRDLTQQTQKQTNKHLIIASHHLLIFHPLKDSRRQQSGQRYCLPPKTWIHCMQAISVHRLIFICHLHAWCHIQVKISKVAAIKNPQCLALVLPKQNTATYPFFLCLLRPLNGKRPCRHIKSLAPHFQCRHVLSRPCCFHRHMAQLLKSTN